MMFCSVEGEMWENRQLAATKPNGRAITGSKVLIQSLKFQHIFGITGDLPLLQHTKNKIKEENQTKNHSKIETIQNIKALK